MIIYQTHWHLVNILIPPFFSLYYSTFCTFLVFGVFRNSSERVNGDKIRIVFCKMEIVNFSYLILILKKSPNFITVYHLKKKRETDYECWLYNMEAERYRKKTKCKTTRK